MTKLALNLMHFVSRSYLIKLVIAEFTLDEKESLPMSKEYN